jgi:hypothetical protein
VEDLNVAERETDGRRGGRFLLVRSRLAVREKTQGGAMMGRHCV